MFEINSVEDLEKLSFNVKWQYFEKLAAFIFERNGFDVEQNVVVSRKSKRQFDVVAKSDNKTFLVECKKWKRTCKSSLKNVIKQHNERCRFYKRTNKENIIPVIVTPLNNTVAVHRNVAVVPITSLNWFINDYLLP